MTKFVSSPSASTATSSKCFPRSGAGSATSRGKQPCASTTTGTKLTYVSGNMHTEHFEEFSMSDATGEMMKFDVTDMDEIEALVNRDTSLTMDTSVSQKYF